MEFFTLQKSLQNGKSYLVCTKDDQIQWVVDLQDLPLGALRRAQRLLTQAEAETDSGSDFDKLDLSYGKDNAPNSKGKGKERVEWSTKPRTDIGSRPNKHA